MEYPRHYFEDEVREGFYITGMMKRVWAAQIEVLKSIDKVCKRHGIKWYADCGTLMGAVRHGGYIPWDDDMDICMLRDDFMRFMEIAPKELPEEGCMFFNLHFDEFYDQFLSRVTNGHGLNYSDEYLERYHDCYLPIGVDIFTLDYLSTDSEFEEGRMEIVDQLFAAAGTVKEDDENMEAYEKLLSEVEAFLDKTYDRKRTMRQLFHEASDDLFRLATSDMSKEVVLMPYWLKHHDHKYPLSSFRESIMLPFENTEIPVPIEYDKVLQVEYGDYMRPVKAGGVHEYPFFEKMEDTVIKKVDKYILRYDFSPDDLNNDNRDKTDHIKAQVKNYLITTKEAHCAVILMLSQGNVEVCLNLLAACQESAINTGNLIEKSYGEGYVSVSAMEAYCEAVYELYKALEAGEFGASDVAGVQAYLIDLYGSMEKELEKSILNRKEMVFIPYRADYWDGMASMWEEAINAGEYNVLVVPIPYYKKTALGGYADEYYEGAEFPEELHIIDYRDYNFKLRHPDVIVTQQAYDECNYCIGVGLDYYSRLLKMYTEQLIYVPPFVMDEIDDKNGKAWKTMDYFCTIPGISHADKVYVQSEQMRQAYIDKLCEFAGEEYRGIWEKKIDGSGIPLQKALERRMKQESKSEIIKNAPEEWKKKLYKSDGTIKKIVLYNVSVSSLAQYGSKATAKINQVLGLFKANCEEIALIWHANPHARKTLKKVDLSTRDKYVRLVEDYKLEDWGIYTEEADNTFLTELADAFYGDGGNDAHRVRLLKKPVMLQNVDLIEGE